ncbi:hypothetical protein AB0G54_02375 [Streptomyces yokosukanensis]|nr:hypothetical protein [Streptomyces yokosukanensis]
MTGEAMGDDVHQPSGPEVQDDAGASAEEAAMHVIPDSDTY